MGFNTPTSSVNLTAKLTPLGRQRLVSTNNALITSFSLGDSDANYNSTSVLSTGEIPSLAGDIGVGNSISNSVTQNVTLRNLLVVNANGITTKSIQSQSINILSETVPNGAITITGTNITHMLIDRTQTSDGLVNLYNSFGLPLNSTDDNIFTGITYKNGGYSDTALSALSTTKIVVLGINNSKYGEMLDGKTVKIFLPTDYGNYTLYSTFQNKSNKLATEDVTLTDTSVLAGQIGSNIAFLFSDDILTPNGGDSTLSWSTGYGLTKPFSANAKQLFNLQTNTNLNQNVDTIVGVAYLDKGIVVITNPQIVSDYYQVNPTGTTTGVTISYDSVSTNVYQNITCIADRGEFGSSTNPSFEDGDTPRISEIGLYDTLGNLIAIGKPDRHITKNINDFLALGVKIII